MFDRILAPKYFLKFIACLTLTCFTYSSIIHQSAMAMTALVEENAAARQLAMQGDQQAVPSRYGRITSGHYSGGQQLVVYLQDLHCNAEVQKNIASILNLFEKKYGVSKIYLEGAPAGKLDTRLLSSIPDENIRENTIEGLVNKGLLGGGEYYALKYKQDKLYGLEEWGAYSDNLERFRKLSTLKEESRAVAAQLSEKVEELKGQYLDRKLKRIEKVFTSGRKETRYLRMERLGERVGQVVTGYPNLSRYIEMIKLNRTIKYKRLNGQLTSYVKGLQRTIPMSVYMLLTEKMKNTDNQEEYYRVLSEIAREYAPGLERSYPEVGKFFAYLQLNAQINPIYLMEEENMFQVRVLRRCADRLLDSDLILLSRLTHDLNDFAGLNMTPNQYRYFEENRSQYAILLRKYFDSDAVEGALNLLGDEEYSKFYTANFQRNGIFVRTISEKQGVQGPVVDVVDGYAGIFNHIGQFKTIDFVIAGGFHMDVAKILKEKNISYLTITPSVTRETDGRMYEQVMTGNIDYQAIVTSALAPIVSICLGMRDIKGSSEESRLMAMVVELVSEALANKASPAKIDSILIEWKKGNPQLDDIIIKFDPANNTFNVYYKNDSTFVFSIEISGEHMDVKIRAKNGALQSRAFSASQSSERGVRAMVRQIQGAFGRLYRSLRGFTDVGDGILLLMPGNVMYVRNHMKGDTISRRTWRKIARWENKSLSDDLKSFIGTHRLKKINLLYPWTSADEAKAKTVVDVILPEIEDAVAGISSDDIKKGFIDAIKDFQKDTEVFMQGYPDMNVAGFMNWAAVRLGANEATRGATLSPAIISLLDEEKGRIEKITKNSWATEADVIAFIRWYNDPKEGFVSKYNDVINTYNKAVAQAAEKVADDSSELTSAFANRFFFISAFMLLALTCAQLITGTQWIPMNPPMYLISNAVLWLLSILIRIPADKHYTNRVHVKWNRKHPGIPLVLPSNTGIAADESNMDAARREFEEKGKINRRTLGKFAQEENGLLVAAPNIFRQEHILELVVRLNSETNVEGYFGWANARLVAINETKSRMINKAVNDLLDEEMAAIYNLREKGNEVTLADVAKFVDWYNNDENGFVKRINDAIETYNQGITKGVKQIGRRSVAGSIVTTGLLLAAGVYVGIQKNVPQIIENVMQVIGVNWAQAPVAIAVVAMLVSTWIIWSWARKWYSRQMHVNWNRKHPEYLLVLPDGTEGAQDQVEPVGQVSERGVRAIGRQIQEVFVRLSRYFHDRITEGRDGVLLLMPGYVTYARQHMKGNVIPRHILRKIARWENRSLTHNLNSFIGAHAIKRIDYLYPWTGRDEEKAKNVTDVMISGVGEKAAEMSTDSMRARLLAAINAFQRETAAFKQSYPDMNPAGFMNWAVVRLQANQVTRSTTINPKVNQLLDEEKAKIEELTNNPSFTESDVMAFIRWYNDQEDGFVTRFNKTVDIYNQAVEQAAKYVDKKSSGKTFTLTGWIFLIPSVLVFFNNIVQFVPMNPAWVLYVTSAAFLFSIIIRGPVDKYFTNRVHVQWNRKHQDIPLIMPSNVGIAERAVPDSDGVKLKPVSNMDVARQQLEKKGKVRRSTLRKIARDENGLFIAAPDLFVREHALEPLVALRAGMNVDGFFGWANARLAAIVETKRRTLNPAINDLLSEEMAAINGIKNREEAATELEVAQFVEWYNKEDAGFVNRFNGAIDDYNRGIEKGVKSVGAKSAPLAVVTALMALIGQAWYFLQGNMSHIIGTATQVVGVSGVETPVALVAIVLGTWIVWSWSKKWYTRKFHVSWNRKHPEFMLTLPGEIDGRKDSGETSDVTTASRTGVQGFFSQVAMAFGRISQWFSRTVSASGNDILLVMPGYVAYARRHMKGNKIPRRILRKIARWENKPLSDDLERFVDAHRIREIHPVYPWTSKDEAMAKEVTDIILDDMEETAQSVAAATIRESLIAGIEAFTSEIEIFKKAYPDMNVAGFRDWAAVRLKAIEVTRNTTLNRAILQLLEEEKNKIEEIIGLPVPADENVMEFLRWYNDEEEGFVQRFNDAVTVYNGAVERAAKHVYTVSADRTSGVSGWVFFIPSMLLFFNVFAQFIPMDPAWLLRGTFLALLASWLVRMPADNFFTRQAHRKWNRKNPDVALVLPSSTGLAERSFFNDGGKKAKAINNIEAARQEMGNKGKVRRRTLRKIAREENGLFVAAPKIFAQEHLLDPIAALHQGINVEGFFAWAHARLAAIVETRNSTMNPAINDLLKEEMIAIYGVTEKGDLTSEDDVANFVAWYNQEETGFVVRLNGAVDTYNRGIEKGVKSIGAKSTPLAVVTALLAFLGQAWYFMQGNITHFISMATQLVGVSGFDTRIALVAMLLSTWIVWSWSKKWYTRKFHVSWNRKHPELMLTLPQEPAGSKDSGDSLAKSEAIAKTRRDLSNVRMNVPLMRTLHRIFNSMRQRLISPAPKMVLEKLTQFTMRRFAHLTWFEQQVRANPALFGKSVIQFITAWDKQLNNSHLKFQVLQNMQPVVITYKPSYNQQDGDFGQYVGKVIAGQRDLKVYVERLNNGVTLLTLTPSEFEQTMKSAEEMQSLAGESLNAVMASLLSDLKFKGMIGTLTGIDPWTVIVNEMEIPGAENLPVVIATGADMERKKVAGQQRLSAYEEIYDAFVSGYIEKMRSVVQSQNYVRKAGLMIQADVNQITDPAGQATQSVVSRVAGFIRSLNTHEISNVGLDGVIAFIDGFLQFSGMTSEELQSLLKAEEGANIVLRLTVPAGTDADTFSRQVAGLLKTNERLGLRLSFDAPQDMPGILNALGNEMFWQKVSLDRTLIINVTSGSQVKTVRDAQEKYGLSRMLALGSSIGIAGVNYDALEVEVHSGVIDAAGEARFKKALTDATAGMVVVNIVDKIPAFGQAGVINFGDILDVLASYIDRKQPLTAGWSRKKGVNFAQAAIHAMGKIESQAIENISAELIKLVAAGKSKDSTEFSLAIVNMQLPAKQEAAITNAVKNIQLFIDKESPVAAEMRQEIFVGFINELLGEMLLRSLPEYDRLDLEKLSRSDELSGIKMRLVAMVSAGDKDSVIVQLLNMRLGMPFNEQATRENILASIRNLEDPIVRYYAARAAVNVPGLGIDQKDVEQTIDETQKAMAGMVKATQNPTETAAAVQAVALEYAQLQSSSRLVEDVIPGIKNQVIGLMARKDTPPGSLAILMQIYLELLRIEASKPVMERIVAPVAVDAIKGLLSAA